MWFWRLDLRVASLPVAALQVTPCKEGSVCDIKTTSQFHATLGGALESRSRAELELELELILSRWLWERAELESSLLQIDEA